MHLIKLVVKNSYAHKHTVVSFKDGLNFLIGANEGGKSELLEMILYALTGKGLRSDSSEYKELYVELTFNIKGQVLKVVRGKTTKLYEIVLNEKQQLEEKILVTAKTPVNLAIKERLGYDYSVMCQLNYSKQLDGAALTGAKTSERLALINKINGVTEANAFEKVLEGQKKDIRSQLKALDTKSMLDSISFTPNEEYETLLEDPEMLVKLSEKGVELYNEIKELSVLATHYNMLPTPVSFTKSSQLEEALLTTDLTNLQKNLYTYVSLKQREQTLSQKVTSLQDKVENLSSHIPLNLVSLDELKEYERIVSNNIAYAKQEAIIKDHSVTCPSCEHVFTDEGLQNTFTLLPLNIPAEVYTVSKTFKEKYETALSTAKVSLKSASEDLSEVLEQIASISISVSLDAVETLTEEIQAYSSYINAKENYENKVDQFLKTFSLTEETIKTVPDTLTRLPILEKELQSISLQKDELTTYQSKRSVYELAKKTQDKLDEQVSVLKSKLDIIEKVLEESKRVRLEIQNNCIPVLNNIASKLINKLTGGKRYGLTMNETFELQLDGKPIEAYSGSTIVLANVAFRIALLEMFFKKTFPVFIGDEIDAYADDTRAQHVHDALVRLQSEGYQIILVSHHTLNFQGNKIDLQDIKNKG